MRNNLNFFSLKERIFLVKTFYKNDSDPKCVKNHYKLEYGELDDGPTDSLIFEVINLFEETGSVKDIPEYKESINPIEEVNTLLCEIKVEETVVKTEPQEYYPSLEGHSIFSDSTESSEKNKNKKQKKKKPKTVKSEANPLLKAMLKKKTKPTKKIKKAIKKEVTGDGNEYICELCEKKCKSMRGMQIHMARHKPKELPCRFCQEIFPSKHKRRLHVGEKHKDEAKKEKSPAQCPFCPKTFLEMSVLRKHLVAHSDKKDAVCDICGKAYKTQQALKLHMRVHTGEEPFKCNFPNCGRSFRIRNSYTIHMRCHNNDRPYTCDYCGKGFTDKGNLRTHYRVHTGENPYKCELCGKETKQKQNLMSHMVHFHKIYEENK